MTDNIIKLRGLPFEAGPAEIIKFFEGKKGRFSLYNFPTPSWLVLSSNFNDLWSGYHRTRSKGWDLMGTIFDGRVGDIRGGGPHM